MRPQKRLPVASSVTAQNMAYNEKCNRRETSMEMGLGGSWVNKYAFGSCKRTLILASNLLNWALKLIICFCTNPGFHNLLIWLWLQYYPCFIGSNNKTTSPVPSIDGLVYIKRFFIVEVWTVPMHQEHVPQYTSLSFPCILPIIKVRMLLVLIFCNNFYNTQDSLCFIVPNT